MRELSNSVGLLKLCIIITIMLFSSCNESTNQVNNLRYIDPQIGGIAPLLQPTRPRMHIPNSMVRMYPARKDYRDDQIRSFPLIVRSHRSNPIFNFLPVSGDFPEDKVPVSTWDQELETASPYYYSTWLEDFDITVEYSPGERTGLYQFNFPDNRSKKLFLKALSGINWTMSEDGSILGTESFDGMNAFAVGVFDSKGVLSKGGENSWISWQDKGKNQIRFKYGI